MTREELEEQIAPLLDAGNNPWAAWMGLRLWQGDDPDVIVSDLNEILRPLTKMITEIAEGLTRALGDPDG